MFLLALFAFLAGVITILSPCILPVLPIILAGSITQGKQRPLGIVTGFIASFTFFTLFLATIVKQTGISADILRQVAILLIIGFGISLVVPQVQVYLEKIFTYFSRFTPQRQTQGFGDGLLLGASLGLLWTPCVGPILAAVISLAISGSVDGSAIIITLAYALGTGLPMLAIMQGGRQLLTRFPWLLKNTQHIQRAFGIVMVAVGIAIAFNLDRNFQTWVLTVVPTYGQNLTKLEENQYIKNQLNRWTNSTTTSTASDQLIAPDFTGGGTWLNSPPLTMAELRGKVVLVDFWTYTCINCIRTFPYVTKWYETYKDKGFVVVGVHSPEFAFEAITANVQAAITKHQITYPVVQDNEFAIWRAYRNQYWPAHYLIDKNGVIRYTHFGEGNYTKTENKIRELLDEEPLPPTSEVPAGPFRLGQTPEIYLGFERAEAYAQAAKIFPNQTVMMNYANSLNQNEVDLEGSWLIKNEYIEAKSDSAKIKLDFKAGQVILVMAPSEMAKHPAYVQVWLDGKPISPGNRPTGMDDTSRILIDSAKEYVLVDLGDVFERHTLTVEMDQGIEAYAFTFGVGSKK